MQCEIEGHTFYSWNEIEGRYSYFEKKYGVKLTRALLEELVSKGEIEAHFVGSLYSYRVYSESNIITAFARGKFKKLKVEVEDLR